MKTKRPGSMAINLNQLDGAYQPSALLTEMMKDEIQGTITSDEIVNKLKETYKKPND